MNLCIRRRSKINLNTSMGLEPAVNRLKTGCNKTPPKLN